MGARLRSWWQEIKQHSFIATGIIVVSVLLVALIVVEVRLYGTGFAGKTLWDWMQLLIIPVVLAVGALLFNLATSRNDQKIAEQRYQTDQNIALNSQRETLLENCFDRLSELLLKEDLLTSLPGDPVRIVAKSRTLTVLPLLDGGRKGNLMLYLYESKIIHVIDLRGADLRGADLKGANLSNVDYDYKSLGDINLSHVDLSNADLSGAILSGVDLSNVDLSSAILNGVDLSYLKLMGSNLSGTDLKGCKLNMTDLSDAKLINTDLRNVDTFKPILMGANLSGANLEGVDLRPVFNILDAMDPYPKLPQLSGANLNRVNLGYLSLPNLDLSQENLIQADLRGANLSRANLRGANLRGANLRGANLSKADLYGAIITPEQLAKAKTLKGTTMPDGSIHP